VYYLDDLELIKNLLKLILAYIFFDSYRSHVKPRGFWRHVVMYIICLVGFVVAVEIAQYFSFKELP